MSHDRSTGPAPARRYSVSLQQAAAAVFGTAVIDGAPGRQEQMNAAPRTQNSQPQHPHPHPQSGRDRPSPS
jgi:hypothetical protein